MDPIQGASSGGGDWEFWSLLVAFAALAVSVAPYIVRHLRPSKLRLEAHAFIAINHQAGRPIVQLFTMIRNAGGRTVRVKRMSLEFLRDGAALATLPAGGYFETPSSQSAVVLVPFDLAPNEEWSHNVNYFKHRDRNDEREYRRQVSNITANIRGLHERQNREVVEEHRLAVLDADPEFVRPFLDRFDRDFVWQHGEYVVTLKIETSDPVCTYEEQYKFVLYESDSDDLRRYTNDYSKGMGIAFPTQDHNGILVQMVKG